jgi:hypothetical protein
MEIGSFTVSGNFDSARAIRDGGIDAIAALDSVLADALAGTPVDEQQNLKRAFGQVMATVMEATVNAAVRAFPELQPDEQAWASIAKSRALSRTRG